MDYFKVFDLPFNATVDQIRSRYRQLALEWHPDKNPQRVEEATVKFKQIGEAYDKLMDPNYRAQYQRKKKSPSKDPEKRGHGSMHVVDAPPPKFDIWGKPLSQYERNLWDQANKIDLTKEDPRNLDRNRDFIDTQRYEDDFEVYLR